MITNPRRDENGIYTWDEDGAPQKAPSVSVILSPLENYDHIHPRVLELAADRGEAVHRGTQLYDEGTLDTDSVHELILAPLLKWEIFRKQTGFEPIYIERFVRSKTYRFGGRLDRLGYFPGGKEILHQKKIPECLCVVDLKCVSKLPIKVGPQTAGYRQAALETLPIPEELTGLPVMRMVVNLESATEYAAWDFLPEEDDWNIFLSCANIYHFKRRKR